MKIANSNNEVLKNFIICPKNGCQMIPKIDYIDDEFYLLIKCNKNNCNYRTKLDINNYINITSTKLECLNYDAKLSNIDDNNHLIYRINNKNFYNYCSEHNKKYFYYCQNCDVCLCLNCLDNSFHYNHTLMYLDDLRPNMNKLEQIKSIINEQENMLNKVKKVVKDCIIRFENDIKLKKLILENYVAHRRDYNSIYNINKLSLIINQEYKTKIDNLFDDDNDNENKKNKICDYTNKMLSIFYYYIMCQNNEKENKILNVIKNEFNFVNVNNNNNNYKTYDYKNYIEDYNNKGSVIKSSKLKIKHESNISKNIKSILEYKIVTSIIRIKSGNLVVGFRNGLIKIYNSEELCSLFNGNEEMLSIDQFIGRKISYLYQLKDSTLLCSTYSKIHKIKLYDNDIQYEYLSKIKLPSFEYPTKIIELGKELIVCLTNKNTKTDNQKIIECYLRIYKINSDSQTDEEIGYLSDYDNENNVFNAGGGFASDQSYSSDFDNIKSFDSCGNIDEDIKLYKKNIKNNTKYICSIFPTKIKNKKYEKDDYLYEFITTSSYDIENANGENKIYFYGISKNSEGYHRLNFNKICEIDDISCSLYVDSIYKLNNNLVGVGIQKYKGNFAECAIIDAKKRELIKILGKEPIHLFNISENKNMIIFSINCKDEENKKVSLIKYIRIGTKITNEKKVITFKDSKTMISFKNQFQYIVELKPINNKNQNNIYYCLFVGRNIFVIQIDL